MIYQRNQSVAYDLEMFEIRKPVKETSTAKQKAIAEAKRQITVGTFVCIALIALCLGMMVNANNILTDNHNKNLKMEKSLTELQGHETVLIGQQESRYTKAEIEYYAVYRFGMTKLSRGQIEYVDLMGGGEEIFVNGVRKEEQKTFLQEALHMFSGLLA